MSLFKSCTKGSVYLTEEEEEEEENNQRRNWLFSCCCLGRKNQKEGFIRLPEGGRHMIDDYLDPSSPMTIETLLAEQEEELDNYMGQASLDDSHHGLFKRKYSLLVNNQILEEEEDAQYLSEHRISAILIDRPQLGSASLFQSEIISPQQDQFVIPEVSTSNRVFAIKTQAPPDIIADAIYCDSPQDLKSSSPAIHNTTSTSSSSIKTAAEHDENYVLPVVGSSTSLSVFPATTTTTRTPTEFPATTLTRTPYQPIPTMHTTQQDIIPIPPHSSMPTPIPPPSRRPSVVSAAQSLLGDKLDDFTEKLAFIKKNIIMSMDSDDDEEEEDGQELRENNNNNNHYYNNTTANEFNQKSLDGHETSDGERRWDTFVLPKFTTTATRSMNSNAVPLDVSPTNNNTKNMRRYSNGSSSVGSSSSSGEEFDFSKVVEISKNVRTFGEGVMGNGLRMFNSLSTRIKK